MGHELKNEEIAKNSIRACFLRGGPSANAPRAEHFPPTPSEGDLRLRLTMLGSVHFLLALLTPVYVYGAAFEYRSKRGRRLPARNAV